MVIVMQEGATDAQIQHVIDRLVASGFNVHRSTGESHTVLGAVGVHRDFDHRDFELLDGVREVMRITQPFKLASRQFKPEGTIVDLGRGVKIGGPEVVIAAGPCSVESREQIFSIAESVAKAGAKILRGGAFKPRTSPYAFQGMGEPGLQLMREAADKFGLFTVSEVMDASQIQMMMGYVDIFQVGARDMQNYFLLRALGEIRKPVLLKRGMSAAMEELLMSAEYILAGGNYNVILCERGIRTFETYTRNTFDIAAFPVIKKLSHLPMLADPSHGTGRRDKVPPMARAAVAAGADGLLIEVHNDPDHALSDGAQSLEPAAFAQLMAELRIIPPAIGRRMALLAFVWHSHFWLCASLRERLRPLRLFTLTRRVRYLLSSMSPHLISRATILGTGLIGGSFALALRKYTTDLYISGWDRPDIIHEARSRNILDEAFTGDLAPALRAADLIFIALPIGVT